MKRILCALTLIAAAAMAWPSDASAQKYRISGEVWGYFEEYLRNIDQGHKPGAFVITTDGYGAWYVWCEQTRCMPGISYSQDALNACEREYETDCVVFAVREKIKVEHEIIGASSGLSTAPAKSPSPSLTTPTTKIVVAAAVKAEIDTYLRNTQRTGRVWALAIANDGSEVATASCQNTGGGGYFGGGGAGCNLVSGTPQEQASREAVMRCGGPTACILLYEGSQRKPSVEIVSRNDAGTVATVAATQPSPEPTATPQTTQSTPEPAPEKVAVVVPQSPPPPATRIVVSAAVKAEIDAYLGNTQRSGKAWALAIANDGSEVASANCPTSGSWSGGRGCEPVKGGPQELASREAIMRCGGAADCALLYEGAQQKGNFEIVMQ